MSQEQNLESRGLHEFVRIGRPDVWYDCRTTYSSKLEEFETAINERKRTASGLADEDTTPATVEELNYSDTGDM